MKRYAAIGRKCLKKFRDQFDIELSEFGFRQFNIENKKGATTDINNTLRQCFIEGHIGFGKSADALFISQRLFKSLADCDPNIFDSMMEVNMSYRLGL